jgi:RimJ/RimL family protein N-acetyltransferase
MNLDDLKIMVMWRNDDENKKYYGNPDFEYTEDYVVSKYKSRIINDDKKKPIIVELDRVAIGYLQYFLLEAKEMVDLDLQLLDAQLVGSFDLFIGSTQYRDKGLGTQITTKLLTELKRDYGIQAFLIKVKSNNKRAIRCYEKCGFRITKQSSNGKLVYMTKID